MNKRIEKIERELEELKRKSEEMFKKLYKGGPMYYVSCLADKNMRFSSIQKAIENGVAPIIRDSASKDIVGHVFSWGKGKNYFLVTWHAEVYFREEVHKLFDPHDSVGIVYDNTFHAGPCWFHLWSGRGWMY